MLQPQLIGILGLVAIAVCWALVVVLYRVGTASSVARKLALLLVIEGVASVAMPNTQNTPEYAAHRKLQVYEAAVAEAVPDGNISDSERALLNSLRESLGIPAADADALEGELLKSQAGIA